MRPAARALAGLWAALLLLAGAGALLLQTMGPPRPAPVRLAAIARPPAVPPPSRPAPPVPLLPPPVRSAVGAAAVAPPDPALLEAAPDLPDRFLPRIGPDGLTPAQAYASHAGLPAHGPQVAILLEGLGLADAVSRDAVDRLPPAISFGVSPYAASDGIAGLGPLLDAARQAGHEIWLSLPMEPAGSPLDDEGAQALTTAVDLDQDRRALAWSLSRLQGYVGVTNALSGLRGDRFTHSAGFALVAEALARRGLRYVDAGGAVSDRPDPAPPGSRRADLTLDEQPDATDIEARLSRLEQIAQSRGSALGVAGPLRPTVIERLGAWSRGLGSRGIALVPVSALPQPASASGSAPGPAAPARAGAASPT